MDKNEVHLHFHLGGDSDVSCTLAQMSTVLNEIKEKVTDIMATTEEMQAVLGSINDSTNKIAMVVEAAAATVTEIGADVDALILASQNAGIPQELLDQANAIKSKAEATSAALDPLVNQLQGVAAKYPPAA